ncbi:PREDICTED: uncharacterized protein LOC106339634 [Brassica oleracea var. oleracea]|uniref:uncharacterized protein LOC106339634 n=1 Tax=Brassica oleracea var. oleracea TaxID=109376 RepID=UPI0006A73898|nr:PREDICTED: uncharacterized protein LOC106339634 [Brassica oleracea var. oleracea]
MFDDSDGASSEDDNFSSYGESPTDDEDSPTLPPKKIYQNFSMSGSKGNLEVLCLKMSSIDIAMDYWKSHRSLKFPREIDEGTPECGFESLPSYLYMIRRVNPSTVTRLHIDELGRFMYVFLAFGASVNGFPFMRKVVVVDDTFLNGKYKGTLLIALAQDGNLQIFPIAFEVVDTENDDSWHWFFTQLKLLIPDDEGLAIISDMHNSIGKAIRNVYPLAARGICTYHLYKNILGRYKGKEAFRLMKKAARCFRMSDFTAIFEEIEAIHPALHGYIQRADVRMWTRVHFPGERYNLMTTNIAESMNRALSHARGLNIVRILETIHVMMTRWFAERREDARLQPTTLTRGVEKLLHYFHGIPREWVQRLGKLVRSVKWGWGWWHSDEFRQNRALFISKFVLSFYRCQCATHVWRQCLCLWHLDMTKDDNMCERCF